MAEYETQSKHDQLARLMKAAKQDDRAAFGQLADLLEPRAIAVARTLTGSDDDAMDLVQECWMRMWKARASWDETRPVGAWFHRILRNLCISHLRSHERLRSKDALRPDAAGDDQPDYELVDTGGGPPAHLAGDERARAFWTALGTLGFADREILALRHFDELSYADIAHTLSIPEGTVMSRLFNARRRLRDALPPGILDDHA